MREEELLLKLREAFQVEAEERISSIFANLAFFEKSSDAAARKPLIEVMFREAHSLKGAARAVNLSAVETLCQALETVFSLLKEHNPEPQRALHDLLYDAAGLLEKVIADPEAAAIETKDDEFAALLARLGEVEKGDLNTLLTEPVQSVSVDKPKVAASSLPEPPSPDKTKSQIEEPVKSVVSAEAVSGADTLRVSVEKLDELMLVAEEFISLKQALCQHVLLLNDTLQDFPDWEKEWRMVKAEIQSLGRTLEDSQGWSRLSLFLEENHNFVTNLDRKMRKLGRRVDSNRRTQSGLVDELLDRVKDVAMMPIETLFSPMSRMVRELGRALGKKVIFEFSGGSIEVDRRVLEEMKDPIIHLLRNAVDHGLESPESRLSSGKDPVGRILCSVEQSDGSSIDITIVDDGQGIDGKKLKKKAISADLLDPQAATSISKESLLDLIFNSGFSTSSMITEISGRGLGMAIVREKIENLGGRIVVSTTDGTGTTFFIHLPVSIAVCRGIRVNVAGRELVFPSLKVERVLRVEKSSVGSVEGRATIVDEDRVLLLTDLAALLGFKTQVGKARKIDDELSLVIVGSGDRRQALVVDEVLGEQEILVKSLGKQLLRVPHIAGATILGSGKVVPILNVKDILENSGVYRTGNRIFGLGSDDYLLADDDNAVKRNRRLLVVDDSITSRTLLQNILETADFQVTTSIDGIAALTLLKSEEFDLVVSDVEMPRMNGFVLTENIRDDERLAEIPVVLVTSLGSREDRELGVAAGANAYIVKSEFDQNNLLEVIERLL